jgi:hypothetical protein
MRVAASDGASAIRPADAASMASVPDATAADATVASTGSGPTPDVSLPALPDAELDAPAQTDGAHPPGDADSCVPLTCDNPTCFPAYCGVIGDGCGGTLRCAGCRAGWSCKGGQCLPDNCTPIACDHTPDYAFCGRIGDTCGGTLDCACPDPEWTCVGNACNRVGAGCVPIAGCTTAAGDQYCGGPIGDGCGGVLDCRRPCARAGFVCWQNLCVEGHDAGGDSGAASVPRAPPLPPPPPAPPPPPPPPCPPPPPPPPP